MASTTTTLSVNGVDQLWVGGTTLQAWQKLVISGTGSIKWRTVPSDGYAQIEGAYAAEDYPSSHHLDLGDAGRIGTTGIATNSRGLSLIVYPVVHGTSPGTPTLGTHVSAISPRWRLDDDGVTRIATIVPSECSNATGTNGPWDIYFCFDDSAWTNNSGSFDLTLTVTDVDEQSAGEVIGLPGHMSQADIDNAGICSVTGLLVPGNRLEHVDGRQMADFVAPYKRLGPKVY